MIIKTEAQRSIVPAYPYSTIPPFQFSIISVSLSTIPLFQYSTIPSSCAMTQNPPTVFLIDDDPSVRRALARLIKSAGYQVQIFVSAREFLERMPDGAQPACLVLDVRMPGLSGIDLQRELRLTNLVLPIIFVTGHGDIPMTVKAMKAGAVDFFTQAGAGRETSCAPSTRRSCARARRVRSGTNWQTSRGVSIL